MMRREAVLPPTTYQLKSTSSQAFDNHSGWCTAT